MESGLLVLLLLAASVIVFLLIRYYLLKADISERAQRSFEGWRDRELEAERGQLWRAAQAESAAAMERWRIETEATVRADAIRRSSAVIVGKVTEHLTPYMGVFPYNPKDARFMGTPVDLVVFDGMSEDDLREIIFLEIKSGSASLSTRERRVRDAVIEKRVQWRELHLPTQNPPEDSNLII